MDFDLEQTDALLSTTRAVRRRLDLDREVTDETLLRCIDLAEQAPTGGNQGSRRWVVVRDAETKRRLADLYREAGGSWAQGIADRLRGTGHPQEQVMASAAHLAENLERVPVLVVVTVLGTHDGSGRPGLFDSVLQAAWSFCLALRARGLGSAWTTVHLGKAAEVADLLEIPDGVTQAVLLPVAWTKGTDFRAAPRFPAAEITYFDRWGFTNDLPGNGPARMANLPGVTAEVDIDARPEKVWELVSDIDLPGRFSSEFQGAEWADGVDEPAAGASFVGRNHYEGFGDYETTSHVVEWDPPRAFAWNVVDPESPGAQWRFDLEPVAGGTRLRQHVTIGPGFSGTSMRVEQNPDEETSIIDSRRRELRENMVRTLEGVKALAEDDG